MARTKILSEQELADMFGVDNLEDVADDLYEQYLDYERHQEDLATEWLNGGDPNG